MIASHPGRCHHCKGMIAADNFARGDECPACGRDSRVCRNCQFFDITCYNECQEIQAERVVEKDRANFCDYFRPQTTGASQQQPERPDPRATAAALFK